ncbi:MAG: cadherin-like beta sandwich domain-containing protein [Prevotella sp.]|nr:cadherin-like beta sandwich domain-containing protein [Prevotella sp.]
MKILIYYFERRKCAVGSLTVNCQLYTINYYGLFERRIAGLRAQGTVCRNYQKGCAFAALVPASAEIPDCTLSSLSIGSLTLSPAFNSAVDSYTVVTQNNTNTVTAAAAAGAVIEITVGGKTVENGSAATWESGENTVTVKVTNNGYSKTYTVVVTK